MKIIIHFFYGNVQIRGSFLRGKVKVMQGVNGTVWELGHIIVDLRKKEYRLWESKNVREGRNKKIGIRISNL